MSSRRAFIAATVWAVLVVIAVHTLQFPGSVSDFTRASGGGVLLDAVPAFGADAVYGRLAGYGESGRNNYSFRNVTVDIVLPLSVFPSLFLLARRALTTRSTARSVGLLILAIPVAYVVFDLLENVSVLGLLASYPERKSVLAGESCLSDADQASRIAIGARCAVDHAEHGVHAHASQRDRLRQSELTFAAASARTTDRSPSDRFLPEASHPSRARARRRVARTVRGLDGPLFPLLTQKPKRIAAPVTSGSN